MVNISIIRVNFASENILPDGNIFGKTGEHNANILEITPPAEMSANENIALYCVAFEVGRDFIKTVVRSEMIAKADMISVPLWHQTTVGENLKFQLEAYDGENNLLIKSQLVEGVFLPSVSGVQSAGDYGCNGLAASVAANTLARHSHENKDILNKLSESDGKLLYNGQSIGGRKIAVKEDNNTNSAFELYAILNANSTGLHIVDYSETIPEGAEISKVELKKTEGDEWVDIRHMYFAEEKPYIIHMGQAQRLSSGELCCASIVFTSGLNSWAESAQSTYIYGIRVTYYTD